MTRTRRLTLVALALVVLAGAWAVHRYRSSQDYGTISFQFVPKQLNSPVEIQAVTLQSTDVWNATFQVRSHSDRAIRSLAAAVVVATPDGRRVSLGRRVTVALAPRATQTVSVPLPELWSKDPWERYRTGAMLTIGLGAIDLDGGAWQGVDGERLAPDTSLVLADPSEERVRPMLWLLVASRGALTFNNTTSVYPINGSLQGNTCTMSICAGGYCEYDGCAVR